MSLWYYICTEPYFAWGLHGWNHDRISQEPDHNKICEKLVNALYFLERQQYRFGDPSIGPRYGSSQKLQSIVTYYPPWNEVSPAIQAACDALRLKIDNREGGDVFNFHYWSYVHQSDNMHKLEKALKFQAVIDAKERLKHDSQNSTSPRHH